MRPFTDKEILDKIRTLPSFTGWPTGIMEVGIRSKADQYDVFDDKIATYDCTSGTPVFVMIRKGTTNTGSYGLKHFTDYNPEGAAVLKSDEIVYDSHEAGKHKGKAAYRQMKSFPYYRDGNKNNRVEEVGPIHSGVIGANIHRAGSHSTVIKNWSTGCIVTADEDQFLDWLDYCKSKGYPKVSLCILKEF